MAITREEKAKLEKVDLEVIKQRIIDKISTEYKQTVAEFSRSKIVKDLKISPSGLQQYLSAGSTSMPALRKLCNHFKLGSLKRDVVVSRKVDYYL